MTNPYFQVYKTDKIHNTKGHWNLSIIETGALMITDKQL